MFPTLASHLIKQLQAIIDLHGDVPVAAQGGDYYTSRLSCSIEPYYYDGGYLIPCDPPGYACNHWVESRRIVGAEIPNKFIRIRAGYPCDENDTIDGVEIKSPPQEDTNRDSYLALVAEFSPKLIRTIEQREAVQQMIDKLVDKPEELNEGEQDYLSLLGSLVEEYECHNIYLEADDYTREPQKEKIIPSDILSNRDMDFILKTLENPLELPDEVKLRIKRLFE